MIAIPIEHGAAIAAAFLAARARHTLWPWDLHRAQRLAQCCFAAHHADDRSLGIKNENQRERQ